MVKMIKGERMAEKNPLVSIVMPVYNVQDYLREALDSLRNQKYRNLDIICVDDGSTDQSLDILKEYAKKDNRIRYIQQTNQYAGVARNNGLKLVTGKYVMFLDSDDVFEKNMVQDLVKKAESNNTDIVFFGFFHFKKDISHRSCMGIPYVSKKVVSAKEHSTDLFQIGQGVPWNRFYNVDFVRKTGLQFQSLQSNNDVFFSKSIMLYADRMLFINKRYVNYRINNGSSLQGSYKLASGNFSKCLSEIRAELIRMNLYDEYKESFEKYVLESFILTLKKACDLDAYFTICQIERDALLEFNIGKDSKTVCENACSDFFINLIDENDIEALFSLYRYMQGHYVSKNAIECRIGRKFLTLSKVKTYD